VLALKNYCVLAVLVFALCVSAFAQEHAATAAVKGNPVTLMVGLGIGAIRCRPSMRRRRHFSTKGCG